MSVEYICDKCGKRMNMFECWEIVGKNRGGMRGVDDWSGRMDLCERCMGELVKWGMRR